uniref:DNA polymerase epsilon subunit 3 n=1 Tax=Panagrolaimus superbus TaxID=310955 RepID=A0A914Z304_9BILA
MAQVNPDDLKLPMAPIVKLMKNAGGDGMNFSNEAKTSIARAAAVFCLHAAESANEFAVKDKRKTITAADIVNAMDSLDVTEFKEEIQATIEEYRAAKSAKKAKK